jgi:hypothetical protein
VKVVSHDHESVEQPAKAFAGLDQTALERLGGTPRTRRKTSGFTVYLNPLQEELRCWIEAVL